MRKIYFSYSSFHILTSLENRDNINSVNFSDILDQKTETLLREKAAVSMGTEINELDFQRIDEIAGQLIELNQCKVEIEDLLKNQRNSVAVIVVPNEITNNNSNEVVKVDVKNQIIEEIKSDSSTTPNAEDFQEIPNKTTSNLENNNNDINIENDINDKNNNDNDLENSNINNTEIKSEDFDTYSDTKSYHNDSDSSDIEMENKSELNDIENENDTELNDNRCGCQIDKDVDIKEKLMMMTDSVGSLETINFLLKCYDMNKDENVRGMNEFFNILLVR